MKEVSSVLVQSGWMFKKGGLNKNLAKRWFEAWSDHKVYYFKTEQKSGGQHLDSAQGNINLKEVSKVSIENKDGFCLLVLDTPNRVWNLHPPDFDQTQLWGQVILQLRAEVNRPVSFSWEDISGNAAIILSPDLHEPLTQTDAVICIQSRFRTFVVRNKQHKERIQAMQLYAANVMIKSMRMALTRTRFVRTVKLAVRIQTLARRMFARLKVAKKVSQRKRWNRWLQPNEWVLLEGECTKKRFTMEIAKRRTLILTDFPRMLYFAVSESGGESSGITDKVASEEMKGEILLAQVRAVAQKSEVQYDHTAHKALHLGSFDVITYGRTFSWTCLSSESPKNPSSEEWVAKLRPLIKETTEKSMGGLVFEGYLTKRGMTQFKNWKLRHFQLFKKGSGGVLRYSTDSEHSGTVKGTINLSGTSVVRPLVDQGLHSHCFEVVTEGMRSYCTLICSSESREIRDKWVSQISSVINSK
jgi:hypothetical protein